MLDVLTVLLLLLLLVSCSISTRSDLTRFDLIRFDLIRLQFMLCLYCYYYILMSRTHDANKCVYLSVSSDLTWWLVSKLLSWLVPVFSDGRFDVYCLLIVYVVDVDVDIDIYFGIGIDLHDTGVVLSTLYTTCIYVQYSMHRYIQPVAASQLVSQFMIWIYLSMDIFCSIQFNSTYAIYVNWFNLIGAIMYATHLPNYHHHHSMYRIQLLVHTFRHLYLFSGFGAVYLISFALFVPCAGKSFADKWPL